VACGRQFIGGLRLSEKDLWLEYVHGKQTYRQLATKYAVNERTIRRRLDKVTVVKETVKPREVVILMDATYFGRGFGVLVIKDALTGKYLWRKYIKQETLSDYREGLEWLKAAGFEVRAIVCDGRRGLLQMFEPLPVQMCQFHQIAIIRRYLTKNPRLEASKELMNIALKLTKLEKQTFTVLLESWHIKWKTFLNERVKDPETRKSRYVHKRLRSAWRSLNANLPWLFTNHIHPNLHIPNTTNALDGAFSNLKNKLRNHNGLSKSRKMKFMDEFFRDEP
jgi:hypothetical protein